MKKNLIYTFVFLAVIFIPNLAKADFFEPDGVIIHDYEFNEDINNIEELQEGDTRTNWAVVTSGYEDNFYISTTTETLRIGTVTAGTNIYADDQLFSFYDPSVYDKVYIAFDFRFSDVFDANSPYIQLWFEGGQEVLTFGTDGSGNSVLCPIIKTVGQDCNGYIFTDPTEYHRVEIVYSLVGDFILVYFDGVGFAQFNDIGGVDYLDDFKFRRISNGTSSDYVEFDNFVMSSNYNEIEEAEVFMYFNETTNTVTSAYEIGYYPDDYEGFSFLTFSYSNNGTATSTAKLKDWGDMPEDINPITRASQIQPACNLIDEAIMYKTNLYNGGITPIASSTIYIDCTVYGDMMPELGLEDYDVDSACDDVATSTGSFLSDVRYGIECSFRKVIYWSFVPKNEKISDFVDSVNLLQKTFPFSLISDATDIIFYPVTATSTPAQIPALLSLVIPGAEDMYLDLADFEETTFYENVYSVVYGGMEKFLYIITFVFICLLIYYIVKV